MRVLILILILISGYVQAKALIPVGDYLSEDCFVRVERDEHFISFQFAHRLQHQFEDIPYEQFHPNYVLGTNIIYDIKSGRVEFGPNHCGQGDSNSYKTYIRHQEVEIKCKNKTARSKGRFKIRFEQGEIAQLSFRETLKGVAGFDFICRGLRPEI